jgi:glyceraldehyde-3-phosphate dehydrogenase (NADP+)
MKMFLRGQWQDGAEKIEVRNPWDGSVVDVVPAGTPADIEAAVAGAVEGAAIMRQTPGYDRGQILARAAELMRGRVDELGRTISLEEGKTFAEGKGEAQRAIETVALGRGSQADCR